EPRLVPVGQDAAVGGVRGEVGPQPAFLRRPRPAAAGRGALAVQGDQVPAPEVEAVPALVDLAGSGAEVGEVAGRPDRLGRGDVLVVAGDGVADPVQASPGGLVPLLIPGQGAVGVDVVAQGEDGVGTQGQGQAGGGPLGAGRADGGALLRVDRDGRVAGDVAGRDHPDRGVGPGRRSGGGVRRAGPADGRLAPQPWAGG